MPACPICGSSKTVKNDRIHNGKQRFKCQDCGRQFVEQPAKKVIDQATRELIDRLLLEHISLAGIARAAQVSERMFEKSKRVKNHASHLTMIRIIAMYIKLSEVSGSLS
ncbi:IS1 family transposase [Coleofasciculus sp. FACHB-129]|nr:IS1 family transposase [Coleofasciculus sp. FACHB-129]